MRAILTTLALAGLLVGVFDPSPALAAPGICVESLSLGITSGSISEPQVSGDLIVWSQARPDPNRPGRVLGSDIWALHLASGRQEQLTTSGWASRPSVSGNMIAWLDFRHGYYEIYALDVKDRREIPVATGPGPNRSEPRISGSYVIWPEARGSRQEVYVHDLATGRTFPVSERQDPQGTDRWAPDVSGDVVVWLEQPYDRSRSDVFARNLKTGEEFRVSTSGTAGAFPRVSSDYVVWPDLGPGRVPHLFAFDLASRRQFTVGDARTPSQGSQEISGSVVAWTEFSDRPSAFPLVGKENDLLGFDLATGEEFTIALGGRPKGSPAISGDLVIWPEAIPQPNPGTPDRPWQTEFLAARLVRTREGRPLDFPIPNGHFYTQANGYALGAGERGYAIVDDAKARMWSEFHRLGGVDALGYPSSRRFDLDGFTVQLAQGALLQWRPERGEVFLANVFEMFERKGLDDALYALGVPRPISDDGSGVDFERARQVRLGWLTNEAIKAKYLANPNPTAISRWGLEDSIRLYGLPMSKPERFGPFITQRFQRVALQLWVEKVPGMPAPGTVVRVLGGDLMQNFGPVPRDATLLQFPSG